MEGKVHRVLIADDHRLVRTFLRDLLAEQEDLELVGEASDGAEAIRLATSSQPDVAVLDLTMPGIGGLEALAEIRKVCPDTRVLVLTMHEEHERLRSVLEAGGAGYVVKDADPAELLAAIRAVAEGRSHIGVPLGQNGLQDVVRAAETVSSARVDEERLGTLSPREREVLEMVARGHTNRDVAEQLHVSVKSVETYRSRLQDKLGLRGRAELVKLALDVGLLQE